VADSFLHMGRQSSAPEGGFQTHPSLFLPGQIVHLSQIPELLAVNPCIKAVTFDMYGTLVHWTNSLEDRHALMWNGASDLLCRHGVPIAPLEFRSIRDRIWYLEKNRVVARGREINAPQTLTHIVERAAAAKSVRLPSETVEAIVAALENTFIAIDSATLTPTIDVQNVLSILKARGIPIGLVSNYPYREGAVRSALQRIGVLSFFDVIVVSSAIGYIKSEKDPDFRIFRKACDSLLAPHHDILHIGDDFAADYRAAQLCGMNAVLFVNSAIEGSAVQTPGNDTAFAAPKPRRFGPYKEQSRQRCIRYRDGKAELASPELAQAAERVYEIGSDIIAPILIKFSENNLSDLARQHSCVNLCIGRDGLSSFLVQRRLLALFPDRYPSIGPKNIRYLSLSRHLMVESSEVSLRMFFEQHGISRYEAITVVDFGLVGTVQNCLHRLYPTKQISGRYLIAHRLPHDPLRNLKSGFLVQTDGQGHLTGGVGDYALADVFLSLDFIHFFEDFWNGIHESTAPLMISNGVVAPSNERARVAIPPGNAVELPGLSYSAAYLTLKKIALMGIVEGVSLYKRRAELGRTVSTLESARDLAEWFLKSVNGNDLDSRLVRAMARPGPDPLTQRRWRRFLSRPLQSRNRHSLSWRVDHYAAALDRYGYLRIFQ
jgi:HAD superfamily hydrolase (TIGR01549 family)